MTGNKKIKKKMLMITIGNFDHASSRVRAIQYIPLLENEANLLVKWIPRISTKPKTLFSKLFIFPIKKRFSSLKRTYNLLFKKWDIIFIQKIFIPNWLLKKINKNGIPIIYDFDDAIYIEQKGQKSNELRTSQMLKAASKVIISTHDLLPFCEKNNTKPIIITSAVDTERIKPIKKIYDEKITIGWIGSHSTTDFLKDINVPLKNISENYKVRILVVGAMPGFQLKKLKIASKKWSLEKEADLINEMDIGIMPLPDTDYAKAKGGYKLYLYMSAGIPIIASPIGINSDIIKHGINGFLANSNEEWIKYLTKLIDNKQLREKMGESGREIIEENYSLNICFEKLNSSIVYLIK